MQAAGQRLAALLLLLALSGANLAEAMEPHGCPWLVAVKERQAAGGVVVEALFSRKPSTAYIAVLMGGSEQPIPLIPVGETAGGQYLYRSPVPLPAGYPRLLVAAFDGETCRQRLPAEGVSEGTTSPQGGGEGWSPGASPGGGGKKVVTQTWPNTTGWLNTTTGDGEPAGAGATPRREEGGWHVSPRLVALLTAAGLAASLDYLLSQRQRGRSGGGA